MTSARIALCALPKSGSSFLTRYLYNGLGIDHDAPPRPVGGFPVDCLTESYAQEIRARESFVWQIHIRPMDVNLGVLMGGGLDRVVVHIRDPRQATLSWAHHARALRVHAYGQEGAFYDRPFEDQIAAALRTHFSIACAWIGQWRRIAEAQAPLKVLITDFEALRQDKISLGERICSFYGETFDSIRAASVPLGDFFRKGESDEWRGVFTSEQAEQCWREMKSRGLDELWAR